MLHCTILNLESKGLEVIQPLIGNFNIINTALSIVLIVIILKNFSEPLPISLDLFPLLYSVLLPPSLYVMDIFFILLVIYY